MPDVTTIVPPNVKSDDKKILVWILALIAAGIVWIVSWFVSRINSESEYNRKMIEEGTAERTQQREEFTKAITLLSKSVDDAARSTGSLVKQSELTVKWLEKLAKDTEAGVWRSRDPSPPSPIPQPQ